MALVVRRERTVQDEALAIAASSFQHQVRVELLVQEAAEDTRAGQEAGIRELILDVVNFSFEDLGVGAVLWTSATILARYIAWHWSPPPPLGTTPRTCLELGCGSSALLGMAAAAAGGFSVTATDLPQVIKLARRNLRRNEETVGVSGGHVRTRVLHWGEAAEQETFDLIVGADILYLQDMHAALATTIAQAADESTEVLLCYRERHRDAEASFFRMLQDQCELHGEAIDLGEDAFWLAPEDRGKLLDIRLTHLSRSQ
mmetsp:Transcript_13582/g.39555  ORF Transcript_13582/g.39555 Transcript_13582/m.39555 type:complete len:258 (-) Transcript_13582:254-1027(-)